MSMRMLVATFLMLFIGLSSVLAQEAGPLTIQEIGKLRLARKTHAQIIEIIKERGLSFEVDESNAAVLRSMGFKPADVELIARIADGRYEQDMKKKAEEEARLEAEKPQPPKAGTAPAGVTIGPRISEGAHETIAKRAMRIKEASNTLTKVFNTETVTLIASEKTSKIHLPNLKKLEADLRKRFGEPTKTGTDKRSAYIVLLDTRYEYENWIKAMFKIYEADGITWQSPEAFNMAIKGPAILTPTMTIVDLSGLTTDEQRVHYSAFCFGYLYSAQLMEGRSPDAVVNGFGNVCEVVLFGKPMIRVNSYAMREIGGDAAAWTGVVRDRLSKGTISSIDKILRFSTASMESHEYCEAWSLTQFLSSTPDLYNRWIQAIRDKEKPLDALLRIYGKNEAALTKDWHRFVGK